MNLTQKPWWPFLTSDQQDNLLQSHTLLSQEEHQPPRRFQDYSFIVFPASKTYEGFLKKLLLTLNLISPQDYAGEHFRIGKSLNPALRHDPTSHQLYDRLASLCHSPSLPRQLWHTWRQSRNLLFHWFPQQKNFITLPEARDRLNLILSAIDAASVQCQLSPPKQL